MKIEKIGNRFKHARLEYLDKTQDFVAEKTGLTRLKISNFETGRKKSVYDTYTNFLIDKGVNRAWLLYGEGNMLKEEEDEKEDNRYKKLELEVAELTKTISNMAKSMIDTQNTLNRFINLMMDNGLLPNMNNLEVGKFKGVPQVSFGTRKVVSLKIAS